MPQFLLTVWHDDEYELDFTTEEARRAMAEVGRFNADLEADGALVFACGLQSASTATVARVTGNDAMVDEGPYAGIAPQAGGFWVIEVADRETAHDWARRGALAGGYPVEVRRLSGQE
jgi:hypothetical protein